MPALPQLPQVTRDAIDRLAFPMHWPAYLQLLTQRLFKEGQCDDAVRHATLFLESRIRYLSDAPGDKFGTDLMSYAFHQESGVLSDKRTAFAEREGLHLMFRGAVQHIRNPADHRQLGLNPVDAYDRIAIVAYLCRTAEELVKQRYVAPYVPNRDEPRSVVGIRRIDLDGDEKMETVVVVMGRWTSSGEILVIRDGEDRPVYCADSRIAFGPTATLVSDDLDQDGNTEVLVSITTDGNLFHGYVVDLDESGLTIWHEGKPNLQSLGWPLEITRPPWHPTPVIVAYSDNAGVNFWEFSPPNLTVIKPPA